MALNIQRVFESLVEGRAASQALVVLFTFSMFFTLIIYVTGIVFYINGVELGQLGDFIGGVLNPILTFLTFLGLLITIVIQQAELRESRKELSRSATALEKQIKAVDRQNLESTFFQMLSLHNTILNSIDIEGTDGYLLKSRDAFKKFFTVYEWAYKNTQRFQDEKIRIYEAYQVFWEKYQQDLSHYFRYLYSVISFIDENSLDDRYIKILKSQLSDYELAVIFYASVSDIGKDYQKYIEKYALFDNLPGKLILQKNHKDIFSPSAYGNNAV